MFQNICTWDSNKSVASHFESAEDAEEKLGVVGLEIRDTLRPFDMLSRGQQHRAVIARALGQSMVVFDEFTSYLDRASAVELAQSLAKYWAKSPPDQLVLLACHDDLIGSDRIRPDFVFETEKHELTCFDLKAPVLDFDPYCKRYQVASQEAHKDGRIKFDLSAPVVRARFSQCEKEGLWDLFSRHHYKDPNLHGSPYFLLTMEDDSDLHGDVVGFLAMNVHWGKFADSNMLAGYLKMYAEHRVVVLPKFQGLGFGSRLSLAAAYTAQQRRWLYKSKTAHRQFGESRNASPFWKPMPACGNLQKMVYSPRTRRFCF